MKKINYKKIYQFVKSQFEKSQYFSAGPFDETYYTLRVYETSKIIMKKLGKKVNKEVILVAALFHDIGKTKLKMKIISDQNFESKKRKEEWYKHAALSGVIVEKYLKENKYPQEFIDEIIYLVENHDNRGETLMNKTLELKILQDADIIADIGMAGFIRPILYGGKFNRSIIETIKHLKEKQILSAHHKLNLKVSKKIAKEEVKQQKELTKELAWEIKSDLL